MLNKLLITGLMLTLAMLSACSTSRVVLLEGDKHNAVILNSAAGKIVLDQTNTYADLPSDSAQLPVIKQFSSEELQSRYGELIANAPKAPISFLLYCNPGSTTLTDASKRKLAEIRKHIKERMPCDINIIGHTDRSGSADYNYRLSLQRAKAVLNWLAQQQDLDFTPFVESYGEEDPLIKTADGVAEPRNRRVELLIR